MLGIGLQLAASVRWHRRFTIERAPVYDRYRRSSIWQFIPSVTVVGLVQHSIDAKGIR